MRRAIIANRIEQAELVALKAHNELTKLQGDLGVPDKVLDGLQDIVDDSLDEVDALTRALQWGE